jgi:hypothetical protein
MLELVRNSKNNIFVPSFKPVVLLAMSWCSALALYANPPSTNVIQFNRDIRPILSDNCFRCHGPDSGNRKAKLRLDRRDDAIEHGAFVPGKPDESELVARIFNDNPDDLMPPPESHRTLAPAQKQLLKDWIGQGAAYEAHWSYIPPTRPVVPMAGDSKSKNRNPIDAFILQELSTRNITPSPEADRRTLLRRLSLDLIGLPPTPAEVNAFLKDKSANAYEKQVDRLLASPHFGERMAVGWLDLVRYADTVGYHGDQNQNVFPYRDYVINAFNANMPFDQFTREQIAGDLLPNPSVAQRTATAFNRLNMMTREGGAQPKEYLAKYAADRVRTVSTTWLGSTMGCAECHDHKFDPFSTKDFYTMAAFFADVKQWGVYHDYGYTPNPDLRGWSNDHPFPPELEVDSPALHRRITKLESAIATVQAESWRALQTNRDAKRKFSSWRAASRDWLKHSPDGWLTPTPKVELKMNGTNTAAGTNLQSDGTVKLPRPARENTKLSLSLTNGWLAAIRVEALPQEATATAKTKKAARRAGDIRLTATLLVGGKEQKLPIHFADADFKVDRYEGTQTVLGVKDGWKVHGDHERQTSVWLLEKPVEVTSPATLVVSLGAADVASVRVSVTPFAAGQPLASGANPESRRELLARGKSPAVQAAFLSVMSPDYLRQVRPLYANLRECRGGRAWVQVTESREPLTVRVLKRGNWQDESGEIVPPQPPHFLSQSAAAGTNRLTRLDLANWLASPENPLTARNYVNRLWKQFFGTALSAVVDDLGAQGEWPTHPALLDWLACEFMQPSVATSSASTLQRFNASMPHAWNVKHVIKLIVMSQTYRQISGPRPDLQEIDPNNRTLAAQSPRRLEAEFVRDNALSVAGVLNPEIGGPSARPYQPPGYYANLQFPDRDYDADADERQYRRGVYSWWQRTFLQPMLANFDAPSREECTAIRTVSNTPQQALTVLNDPTFVETARLFAGNLLSGKASDEKRLETAFQQALARSVKPKETESLKQFLATQREYYSTNPAEAKKLVRVGNAPELNSHPAPELASWTQVCRVILNLHETLTRY